MRNLKTLYVRNVLEDLIKKKVAVGIFIVICAVLFGMLGIVQGGKAVTETEEQKQEIEEYNAKIAEYDSAIEDTQNAIAEADKQIESLQEYIDNSIYMQIDPNNIQTVSVQYGLKTSNNVGNILNSFITYINDGGLKEELSDADEDLKVKYWRDVVSCYQSSNNLIVTVVHSDMDQAKRIMSIMKERVMNYVPKVKNLQGDFSLEELKTSEYVKTDTGVVNNQNNNRNNLKNYTTNRADLNNKLIGFQNSKKTYIEKNEPDNLKAADTNTKVLMVAYVLLGILFGAVIAFVLVALKYILGDTLRTANDIKESNLNLLGTYSALNQYKPDLERSKMDVEVLAKAKNADKVFFYVMSDDEISKKVAKDYEDIMKASGIAVETGSNISESAEELKKMIACGNCVFIAEVGKTTYRQLELQTRLCERFKTAVLGCVVVE
ncbi:hypothetical protein DWV69_12720 [Clostridium sp. AF12-19]|nr:MULTISPECIES: hypothetical protein [unclassified Clostridium]RHS25984.1 hypothetical protein DWV69_12720 [Clostridium sp. AF12-19]RHS26083.1 hypothetical protein DWV71_00560 [Clostridium sp. AF12-28]